MTTHRYPTVHILRTAGILFLAAYASSFPDELPDNAKATTIAVKKASATSHRDGTWDKSKIRVDFSDYYEPVESWTEIGSKLIAAHMARAEWEFVVPADGMYRFGLKHYTLNAEASLGHTHRIRFLVDHLPVHIDNMPAAPDAQWRYFFTPWLTKGSHTFRIVWRPDKSAATAPLGLEEVCLQQVSGPDSNGNGMQDWVETRLERGLDTDSDGLPDIDEITKTGTDPLKFDTDGDLLADGAESRDYLTDPLRKDSDGDGIADGRQIDRKDGARTSTRVKGGAHQWYDIGKSLVCKWSGGKAEYTMSVPKDGFYVVDLQLRNWHSEQPDDYRFEIDVSVDDQPDITVSIAADNDYSGHGHVLSPWLTSGQHKVRLAWKNATYSTDGVKMDPNIEIEQVALIAIDGPDRDRDGREDWVVARKANIESFRETVAAQVEAPEGERHALTVRLISACCEAKRYDDADAAIRQLLAENPTREIRDELARIAARFKDDRQRLETAVAQLKAHVTAKPGDVNSLIALAESYRRMQAFHLAHECYQKASETAPDPDIFIALAEVFSEDEQNSRKIDGLRESIAATSAGQTAERAREMTVKLREEKKMEDLRVSLKKSPNNAAGWEQLGKLLETSKRRNEAADAYLNALRHNPTKPIEGRCCERLAAFYEGAKDHDKSAEYYSRALAINPGRNLAVATARVASGIKDGSRKIALLESAVRSAPDCKAHFSDALATAYADAREWRKALPYAEDAVCVSGSIWSVKRLAKCYTALKEYDKAIYMLQQTMKNAGGTLNWSAESSHAQQDDFVKQEIAQLYMQKGNNTETLSYLTRTMPTISSARVKQWFEGRIAELKGK